MMRPLFLLCVVVLLVWSLIYRTPHTTYTRLCTQHNQIIARYRPQQEAAALKTLTKANVQAFYDTYIRSVCIRPAAPHIHMSIIFTTLPPPTHLQQQHRRPRPPAADGAGVSLAATQAPQAAAPEGERGG